MHIAPAEIYIISQTSLKIKKVSLSFFFNKTKASILFLGFQYFELRNILNYEIFIKGFQFIYEFQYSEVSFSVHRY